MLARVTEYNKKVVDKNTKWEIARLKKLRCRTCKIMEYVDCPNTEEHGWEELELDISEGNREPNLSTTQSTTKTSPWSPSGPPSTRTSSSVGQKNAKVLDKSEELVQLDCCGAEIQAELSTNCEECGPLLETSTRY